MDNVTASPSVSNGISVITVDLTHNSEGNDTSSQGHLPDNIPVNFTTNFGTITQLAYTRNGKASSIFSCGTSTSGTARILSVLDGQSVQINVTIDAIAPAVNTNIPGGIYNGPKNVILTATDNFDLNPRVYYSTDNGATWHGQVKSVTLNLNQGVTNLKFYARDAAGNSCSNQVITYTIDLTAPMVVASPVGGVYNTTQSVNLTAIDNLDPNPVIYYTTNGSNPTTSSTRYTDPITITNTTTLKFIAVDAAGNQATVQSQNYILNLPIINVNTGIYYPSIQVAIDDNLTLDGHTIEVSNGTYVENVVVNKRLTIQPVSGSNVTVRALDSLRPVFTINSGGSGSFIMDLNIIGSAGSSGIYINGSVNNTIYQNNITGTLDGLYLNNSTGTLILGNGITNNTANGIYIKNSSDNIIYENILKYNVFNGISVNSSDNSIITTNAITNNSQSGIYLFNSNAEVHFNQIFANTMYGLYNLGNGTVNATNNWWGTNIPLNSTSNGSAVNGGMVLYDPYLVLNLTGSTVYVTKNSSSGSQISADLTHNNRGDDTSSSGAIPDGLPVNFTATLPATITSSATTRRGKATVTLTSSSSDGATTVTVTLDNQTVSKAFCKSFSSIQAAVNNTLTVDGDVILVENGTYTENVVVNKKLTIVSEGNVTVQALNSSNPVFIINSSGSGTVIAYFKIVNATNSSGIYLNSANNCIIYSNNITGNWNGIRLDGSVGNIISYNSLLNNGFVGMGVVNSINNTVVENNITNNTYGISSLDSSNNTISKNVLSSNSLVGVYIANSNDEICENRITYNYYGIYFYASANNEVHFNQIFDNYCGLVSASTSQLVNATNNWWGNNTLRVISSDGRADISIQGGNVDYSTYIVLTVSPTSYKVANGRIYESIITADLTHNNRGEDISLQGCVPDGILVHFVAQYGTIPLIQYTSKGKASASLVLNQTIHNATGVIAVVDNAGAITSVDWIANANIIIISAAIDLSTNQPLNVTYTLPLNESATWVSVLWKNTGMFHNEVDLIVDGNVVLTRNVVNSAYITYQNSYSAQVFNQTLYLNGVFLNPLESNIYLQNFIKLNPQYQNYTKDQLLDVFLARIKQQYSFTDNEINFIRNNRSNFTDSVFVLMTYPGDASEYLTLENSNTNETLSFVKPGAVILRESPMIYFDGYTEDGDAGYEGVRSFAIVTTKVTNSVMQYWLDKQSLYAPGAMKAAYGTFLSSLLVIKCHDMVADQAATAYNVTWCRTTPVVVSCLDDAKNAYITGESSLRMGMDVNGTVGNVWAFRFACSSAFSPIEYCVAGDSTGLSVTLGLGERILNGEIPELFYSNGYLVYKIQGKDDLFLLLDPVTGIVTDCALGINGVYCFHDQITNNKISLAQNLTSGDPSVQPGWQQSISNSSIMLGSFAAMMGTVTLGETSLAAAELFPPVLMIVAPIAFLEALQPYAIEEAEQEGNFNTAEYLTNNDLKDQMWDVMIQCLGIGGPSQGVWDESNEHIRNNENVKRNLQDIKNMKESALTVWNGLYNNLSCPYDRYRYEKAKLEWEEEYDTALSQPPTDPLGQFLVKLVKESVKKCDSGITKIKEGDIVGGAIDLALGTAGFDLVTATIIYKAWPEKPELPGNNSTNTSKI